VGVISFGVSPLCTGVSGAQRVDLIAVLSWVRSSSSVCGGEYIYYVASTGKVFRVPTIARDGTPRWLSTA
jgi:hypothetical protein